ncbi:DUF4097 domain-containing protein [Paenibacillus lemnae]|uniref:DUF4097 domain-containing protein n=2 Tax=Paenibacillus lemnae TaxID=1330551 RepID=A0A848M6X8_PAELE|nr:DUF4097 domain-containing protein [Paenibacillus lemnae]
MTILTACGEREGTVDVQSTSLEGVEQIHIDHGSTSVHLESDPELSDLEVSITTYDSEPAVLLDTQNDTISISMNYDLRRIVNIGRKPHLTIRVPDYYKGKIVVQGSSGNVNSANVQAEELIIQGKSGRISLDYEELRTQLQISAKSGNVSLSLNDKDSDVTWSLKSGSGRRTSAIGWDNTREGKDVTQGVTGSGTYRVDIQTSSGNISIQ